MRRPLPLVEVPTSRAGTAVYGVAALDYHGRIADRVVLRALGLGLDRLVEPDLALLHHQLQDDDRRNGLGVASDAHLTVLGGLGLGVQVAG